MLREKPMFKRISVAEAKKMMAAEPITIIDIREPEVYRQGHIPEAKQVSFQQLNAFCQTLNPEQAILVYCYHGNSSQMVAQHLVDAGFAQVYSLDGGYEAWRQSQE
jgi:thiosulfate sulfurtransferase